MSCCDGHHHSHHHDEEENEDVAEMNHFFEIINSFKNYRTDSAIASFDAKTKTAVEINARFLDAIVANSGEMFGTSGGDIQAESSTAPHNVSKVRSTLKQFVREWSHEGAEERAQCFSPILQGLQKFLPIINASSPPFILCPGSGLGRLPYEIAALGYDCQGNEFSYHMLLGSHFILNSSVITGTESTVVFPYALNFTNTVSASDRLRPVRIPDIVPSKTRGQMSMCAGEFVEVYERQGYGIVDGIVTCFFIDTAKNILLYIRTIANAVKPGGVWVNLGPLLYHYAEHSDAVSIEFSWEEVKEFISEFFDFKEEKTDMECVYSSNKKAMVKTVYKCIHFVAIRNDRLVEGYSNPVF